MADTKEQHPQPAPVPVAHPEHKAKPGAAWKDGETHVLPKNNLPVVFTAFGFCMFLAALDQVSPPSHQVRRKQSELGAPRLDHRRYRVTHHCPSTKGWRRLQLGRNVRDIPYPCDGDHLIPI